MTSAVWNLRRLNVATFAKAEAVTDGVWRAKELTRLAECAAAPLLEDVPVRWAVRGERRAQAGDGPQTWLHLQAEVDLPLQCQRCLEPVVEPLRVDRPLRFVAGEAQAALLDADSEDDVLPLSAALDVQTLIEDELLLVMPIVPRHGVCPQPLVVSAAEGGEPTAPDREHPFAALEQLRGDKPPRGVG